MTDPAIDNSTTARLTYTIPETAGILGCSTSLLYKLATQDKIPFTLRLGKRILVSRFKLEQYLAVSQDGK